MPCRLGVGEGAVGKAQSLVDPPEPPQREGVTNFRDGVGIRAEPVDEIITLADHACATAHVECRKDEGVLDETPGAYKDIDAVMAAQADLVEIVHTLRQVVCVKG